MKKIINLMLYSILAIFTSCEKEDLAGEKATVVQVNKETSEIFTLNSGDNKGFSAENLRMGDFPKIRPDFIIIPQTNQTGDVMSPFLSHPNLEKRFVLSNECDDSTSASAFFESFDVAPEHADLQQFALNLKPNQVWLVKTRAGEFCKVLILETNVDKNTAHVEIKFKAEKMI